MSSPKERGIIVALLFLALTFLTFMRFFPYQAIWLYALAMLSIFTGLILITREVAQSPKQFWGLMALSFAIIFAGGVVSWFIGAMTLPSP